MVLNDCMRDAILVMIVLLIIGSYFNMITFNIPMMRKEGVENDSKYVMTKYYVDWCVHCKKLSPVWEELKQQNAGNANLKFVEVNCEVEKNKCQDEVVRGYPTVRMYHNGKKAEYNGPRTLESLQKFIDAVMREM